MPVLQATRYDEILSKRISQAMELGMDGEFMKLVLQAIHENRYVSKQKLLINRSTWSGKY